ncbi:MFS general substrate transporter [Multifurca ochricompacta]|uniref:MFS general substrate transporter n=1 Tax=Multifurca ochricompacta TaxID=376703 RepID=A0AAD4M4E5_9AGAM|nr:MFS general substrate transporter [Multifurca ochricompacta]
MSALIKSNRSPTFNKEDGSDVISNIHGDDHENIHPIDLKVFRRATLKIDFYLIPIVAMYYLLSFLDRSNIGNARVAGLTKDLNMTSSQFSTALTITYIPYALMELPMNLLMKRIGANVTLPVMVVLWGVACASQGAVHSYHGLLACRFFLGVFEGGLFPGIVLLLSNFYKRHSLQFRFAMMFNVSSLAGAFSGLLAFGIQKLDGKGGIAGWQWLFLLEGAFTATFGLLTFFLVPASPRSIKHLTDEEREAYCRELADDWSGDADADGKYEEVFSWSEVASAFTDAPHILMLAVTSFFNGVTLFGLANFIPTIVNSLGHSPNLTQLLTVPPYACSFVFNFLSAYFCDKYKSRGVTATFCALIAGAGYAIFLGSDNKKVEYGSLYLQIVGVYGTTPCLSTWATNNVQPHYRRATAVAIVLVMANFGAIVSTWLFTDPPRFHKATSINFAFSIGMAATSVCLIVYFKVRNTEKRREVERLLRTQGEGAEKGGWDSAEERRRLGDRHPRFEFTL